MFKRSRKKIIGSITGSLIVLFAVTLAMIYLTNLISQREESRKALEMYVGQYSLEQQPDMEKTDAEEPAMKPPEPQTLEMEPPEMQNLGGNPPAPPENLKERQSFLLSTYYAVAFSPDGEVLSVNNGDNGMQSKEALVDSAREILESGRTGGTVRNLTYRVKQREDYTVVAMIDNTLSDNHLRDLMLQMILIGSIALVVLILISTVLARRIVRPLEENDRRQKAFISDAGHELKTPIAVISANLELLKREPENRDWMENIEYENEKMSSLVRRLLELSRAERTETVKEEVDLTRLLTGEILAFESLAFEAGKKIRSEMEPEMVISGDRTALQQLVSILLDNAICYGTGEEILVRLKKKRRSSVLSVSNEAPSMSETEIADLFDRFHRKEEARSDQGGHFGLGLSIAKAIAASHGSELNAEWKDGWITFRIVFP